MTPKTLISMAAGVATMFAASFACAATPIDDRTTIPADSWKESGEGEWISPAERPAFPFDELIYSWDVKLPEGEGFRLHFQVNFSDGTESSPWLYGGYWGAIQTLVEDRKNPEFPYGKVEMDQLLLQKKAQSFQFKLTSTGTVPLTTFPELTVITTDNDPTAEMAEKYAPISTMISAKGMILDLPLRQQCDSKGNKLKDKCQSAAVATAMQYFGKDVPLEDIVKWTHDPEYDYPGIWPRTIGVATQYGFDGYIDRFRNWQQVESAIASGRVILASTRTKDAGPYKAAPYEDWGGHIVAINGITEDGRVVVTDSALTEDDEGYLCQWYIEDFEKAWMNAKGGVGMVIVPPEGFETKLVETLPPFDLVDRAERAAKRRVEAEKRRRDALVIPMPTPAPVNLEDLKKGKIEPGKGPGGIEPR